MVASSAPSSITSISPENVSLMRGCFTCGAPARFVTATQYRQPLVFYRSSRVQEGSGCDGMASGKRMLRATRNTWQHVLFEQVEQLPPIAPAVFADRGGRGDRDHEIEFAEDEDVLTAVAPGGTGAETVQLPEPPARATPAPPI